VLGHPARRRNIDVHPEEVHWIELLLDSHGGVELRPPAYGPELGELAQRLSYDVHQILAGTKPGDIPIYQPTKLELLASILARADEVFE